jgi:hypothetical protein
MTDLESIQFILLAAFAVAIVCLWRGVNKWENHYHNMRDKYNSKSHECAELHYEKEQSDKRNKNLKAAIANYINYVQRNYIPSNILLPANLTDPFRGLGIADTKIKPVPLPTGHELKEVFQQRVYPKHLNGSFIDETPKERREYANNLLDEIHNTKRYELQSVEIRDSSGDVTLQGVISNLSTSNYAEDGSSYHCPAPSSTTSDSSPSYSCDTSSSPDSSSSSSSDSGSCSSSCD